ncbi:MAG: site-specific DNA-methyltransferase [Bacillota bacterium]|jgi:adenine-specific DNA-methyltransferase
MEHMKFETPDLTAANVEKIGALFPNCVTETIDENGKLKKAINFDLLRQMLSADVVEGDEAYEFTWVGKKAAIVEANKPIRKTLRPCKEKSVDWDTTENLYIEGDNLEVLKILQESYLEEVDVIYIDPPYNTGKDFVYPDSFLMNDRDYNEGIGYFNEDGSVNFRRENNAAAARYHSDWCSMMYSRLMLARNLLNSTGIIFVSIDDNEYENLKKMMDDVFGFQNYLVTFHIQVRYSNKTLNEKNDWQPVMEYVLIYAKNTTSFSANKPYEEYSLDGFIYEVIEGSESREEMIGGKKVKIFSKGNYEIVKHNHGEMGLLKGTWASGSVVKGNASGKYFERFLKPRKEIDGLSTLYKVEGIGEDGLGYRYFTGPQKESATQGLFYSGVPLIRVEEIKNGTSKKYSPIPNFYDFSADFGNIRHEGGIAFNSGKKPVKMMKQLINYCSKKNALILDFFSGSASTAEGVLQLNMEDDGDRHFIMVQVPEITDEKSDAYRAGFKTICELGEQRIKNAIEKIKNDSGVLSLQKDLGFRVFKLDDSNMNDVYYSAGDYNQEMLSLLETNMKSDRTDMDLLFGCLLEWGLPLSMPYRSEKIEGCTVHTYNDGDLIACFDENIPDVVIKEIARRQPLRAVFRDGSFNGSPAKINVGEIFKMLAPDTRVKVI